LAGVLLFLTWPEKSWPFLPTPLPTPEHGSITERVASPVAEVAGRGFMNPTLHIPVERLVNLQLNHPSLVIHHRSHLVVVGKNAVCLLESVGGGCLWGRRGVPGCRPFLPIGGGHHAVCPCPRCASTLSPSDIRPTFRSLRLLAPCPTHDGGGSSGRPSSLFFWGFPISQMLDWAAASSWRTLGTRSSLPMAPKGYSVTPSPRG